MPVLPRVEAEEMLAVVVSKVNRSVKICAELLQATVVGNKVVTAASLCFAQTDEIHVTEVLSLI